MSSRFMTPPKVGHFSKLAGGKNLSMPDAPVIESPCGV